MASNNWYDALDAAVHGTGTLAIVQPGVALPPQSTNDALWALFNRIPPLVIGESLTMSGGNQLYPDYTSVLSQLLSSALTNFQNVLGPYYPQWQQHLGSLSPAPLLAQLPDLFFTWAMTNAPSVATAGRAAYVGAVHDPIFAAQTAALNTANFMNDTPNFANGMSQLFVQLVSAPGPITISFSVPTNATPLDGTATIQKLFTFSNAPAEAPNGWFSTAILQQAFAASSGGAPWRTGASPNWQSTFGAQGNLQRFITSLVIADGIETSVQAPASSTHSLALMSAHEGVFPLCVPSTPIVRNAISRRLDGTIDYAMSSPAGQPVVIGAFIQTAARFIGGGSVPETHDA